MNEQRTRFLNRYVRPYLKDTPQKGYTMLLLSLAVFMTFGYFGAWPAVKSALITRENIVIGKVYSRQLDQKIKLLKEMQNNLAANEVSVRILDSFLPGGEGVSSLLQEVTIAATHNNVKVDFFQQAVSEKEGSVQAQFNFWLGISGDSQNIIKFLQALPTLTRPLSVSSINISVSEGGTLKATALISAVDST